MEMPLWFSNLVFWSVQVALLVLAAGFLARILKLRQPRVLLAYWRSLLVVSLLLPLFQPWHRPQNAAAIVVSGDIAGVPLPAPSAPAAAHWHVANLQTIAPFVGVVILAGMALRLALFALGLLKLRRLRQASIAIPSCSESAGILEATRTLVAAGAEFRLSSQVDSPVTFGFVAPVVLLPGRFASLDARFQSAIACHELLHVRRHDWAYHLSEEILRAMFWFHPAIAWLISRVRLTREQVVDLEVVRLTNERKTYIEALLEFTNNRASFTAMGAILAPPFLAEHQLIERVTLMLKEVRMSRKRLIASLTITSCCLAMVLVFAAWTFPLKARGVAGSVSGGVAQGVAGGIVQGISHGVAGGITKGVVEGVSGGISGGISGPVDTHLSEEPGVDISTIWTDTVKRGAMPLQVRGMGTIVGEEASGNLVAHVTVPASMAAEVKPGQNAAVGIANVPVMKGHVSSVGPLSNDTRTVDVALDAAPKGTTAHLKAEVTIDFGKLDNVLYIGRPVKSGPNREISLFKIVNNGAEAVRTNVKLGRASANTIEVLDGLKEGDKVILSDTSSVESAERIRLTDEKHLSSH